MSRMDDMASASCADEARNRAIAKAGRDIGAESWEEARHFVEHTFIGANYLLHERVVDLGRVIRDALPGPLRRLFTPERKTTPHP